MNAYSLYTKILGRSISFKLTACIDSLGELNNTMLLCGKKIFFFFYSTCLNFAIVVVNVVGCVSDWSLQKSKKEHFRRRKSHSLFFSALFSIEIRNAMFRKVIYQIANRHLNKTFIYPRVYFFSFFFFSSKLENQ